MATIGDVAKAAGVSRSTVSYALSGKRSISLETQRRIRDAITTLNFTVNAGARALATRRTMALGMLVHFDPDEFAPAMMEYILPITTRARELGYDILMATEPDGAAALTRVTSSDMVDGVILLSVSTEDDRLPALRTARQPGAAIGIPRDPTGIDAFDLDFRAAAQVLVDHLITLGHRAIGLITPPTHVFERGGTYGLRFRDAAVAAAALHGVELRISPSETSAALVEPMINTFLDENSDVTGLIVHSDRTIAMLPSILGRRGVTVPEQLSVVSLYSGEFARDFSLPYTYVETGPVEIGTRVVELLAERIEHPDSNDTGAVQLLAARLVDRGSAISV